MKYRLTEDWLEYKKGQIFEEKDLRGIMTDTHSSATTNVILFSLLLKTGILEEVREIYASPQLGVINTPSLGNSSTTVVKEEEWPKKGDRYWFINFYEYFSVEPDEWDSFPSEQKKLKEGNVFRSESEALEASEKIKTLLLSLKK